MRIQAWIREEHRDPEKGEKCFMTPYETVSLSISQHGAWHRVHFRQIETLPFYRCRN